MTTLYGCCALTTRELAGIVSSKDDSTATSHIIRRHHLPFERLYVQNHLTT